MKSKISPKVFQERLNQAIGFQNGGDLVQARAIFLELLRADPKSSAVLYSLGAIESSEKNFEIAHGYIKKLLSLSPKFALGHLAMSIIYSNTGKYEESLKSVKQALGIDPGLSAAKSHLEMVEVLLKTQPADGINTPAEVITLTTRGVGLQNSGDNAGAENLLLSALEIDPKNFTALYTLGIINIAYGNNEKALNLFSKAIEFHPSVAPSYHAKGKLLTDMGQYSEALDCYRSGAKVDPKHTGIYLNIAALLQFLNRHKDALTVLVEACEHIPDNISLLESQGVMLTQFKEFKLAGNIFKRILELDPKSPKANAQLMLCMVHNSDWDDFDTVQKRIVSGVEDGSLICAPLTFTGISGDVRLVKKATQGYVNEKFKSTPTPLWTGEKYKHPRKRVAFISSDFRLHPVGYLFISMIEKASKNDFELIGISLGINDQSELWRRYRCAFEHYLDCQTKTSIEIAKIIRALEVDILIDLSGHTEGERLEVFAHRPCPVQMTYLGFPGTLCLPFVDYLIVDPITVPPEHRESFSEKILELEHCYLPRDNSVKPSALPLSKSEYGLPEKGFVFCSFNHNFKVTPSIFDCWMELLKSVPGSVLWLMKLTQEAQTNLIKTAQSCGVSEDKIVFASRVPKLEDHLARYAHADLFLDTFPYNGHTTVGDSLLCGVPVVTLRGSSFASRVASSLLNDVDLMENVCETEQAYFQRALELAQNPQELNRSREKLAHALKGTWPRSDEDQSKEFFDSLKKIDL
jgi:predicted O-linked N-acetylglucosamine transferase (SPINDLY family)